MRKKLKVKSLPPPTPPLGASRFRPSRGRARERGRNEQGFVLVVALLALLVVTVIGVLAISTSTTEVMVAGNTRLREINFSGAESGLEISDPAIKFIVSRDALPNYAGVVFDPNLATELRVGTPYDPDTCSYNPDMQMALGNMTVRVDIDHMFTAQCEGAAIEFASGYEGIGMGTGGAICAYYRVNSMSRGDVGSENVVGGIYRYVAY